MEIVLATLNARWAHTALGLRCLRANLGPLRDHAVVQEYTLDQDPEAVASAIASTGARVVGLGATIWNAEPLARVAAALRRAASEAILVIGGPEMRGDASRHPLFQLADVVVVGEADLVFAELAPELLAGHRPPDRIILCPPPDLERVVIPDGLYDDTDLGKRVVYLETSRGCPFGCEFCLSSLDEGVRYFPAPAVVGALERLWARGLRRFRFVDRTFNLRFDRVRPVLDFFSSRPDRDWFVHLEIAPTRLPERLRAALRRFPPGALQLEVGVQTFDDEVARRIGRPQRATVVSDTLRFLREETRAHLHADLIVGLPGEDVDGVARSFDRLWAHGPHEIQIGILKKLPGAPIARHDGDWGMVYNPRPPYEVLETSRLDRRTLDRLKRVARHWDKLGNSGRLRGTVPLLLAGHSPFASLLHLSDWLHDRLGTTFGVPFERYVELIADYLRHERGLSDDEVLPRLAIDYRSGGRRLPRWLRPHAPAHGPQRDGSSATPRRQARHRRD